MIQQPAPIYYQFLSNQIDFRTTTKIFLDQEKIRQAADLVLNFSKAAWITPFGMVMIYGLVKNVTNINPAVQIKIMFSDAIISYINRMHLVDALNNITNVEVVTPYSTNRENDRSTLLMEFRAYPINTANEADELAEKIFELIATNIYLDQELQNAINTGLSELLDNIYSHAGTNEALVAVQTNKDKILIGIGDLGVGIPEKLRPIINENLSDAQLIKKALEPKVTTRPGGGGTGLTDTLDAIQNINDNGALMIRSNSGWVWATRKNPSSGAVSTTILGTFISLYLNR